MAERGGREDLHRLAADLQFEVDDLVPGVDAAARLGTARIEHGDVVLESQGLAFAAAPMLPARSCSASDSSSAPPW